jgi:hypothetical protein
MLCSNVLNVTADYFNQLVVAVAEFECIMASGAVGGWE